MKKLLTNEVRAYIAGFLDGDGSIFISRHPNRFKLRVAFANVDKNVMAFIRAAIVLISGSKTIVGKRTKFSKPNTRDEYLLDYCGISAKRVSASLMPFLFLKKRNAVVAGNFPVSSQGCALREEDKELQKMLRYEMKTLNQNSHDIIIAHDGKALAAEDLAWLAGFFDAEGSIHISRFARKNGTGYRLGVSISNTNRSVLEYIISKFAAEGKIVDHKDLCGNRKEGYEFYIYGNEAKSLLKALYPYLIVKKEKAVLALAFPISEMGNAGRTIEEKNGQEMAYAKMAYLNKTGVD